VFMATMPPSTSVLNWFHDIGLSCYGFV